MIGRNFEIDFHNIDDEVATLRLELIDPYGGLDEARLQLDIYNGEETTFCGAVDARQLREIISVLQHVVCALEKDVRK